MSETNHQIHMIPLDHLHNHPMNANRMTPAMKKKLANCLKQAAGHYEPLVVRPLPNQPDHYQLINGHHRAQVLRELGEIHAACLVWQLSDPQTLWLLATVNRVAGQDVPERRLALLQALATSLTDSLPTTAQLAHILPETSQTLDRLLQNAQDFTPAPPPAVDHMPEALTIFLSAAEKKTVLTQLRQTHPDPRLALLTWTRERTQPPPP